MPLLYLDVIDGDRRIEDPEGEEFPDVQSALIEARETIWDLVAAAVRAGVMPALADCRVDLRNEGVETEAVVRFVDAFSKGPITGR